MTMKALPDDGVIRTPMASSESILEAAKVEHLRDGENPARWKGCLIIRHLLPRKSKVREVQHHKAAPWQEMPAFMAELQKRPSQRDVLRSSFSLLFGKTKPVALDGKRSTLSKVPGRFPAAV
jgi:hypothetical protein